jgi:RNA polymerase sigma-70 factor (ECF subfamily)
MHDAIAKARVDPELIRRIGAHDELALAELYDRVSPVLFATALRILHERREAEDVLQDVFVQVWDKAATFNEELGSPISWLLTITRNKAIVRLRMSHSRLELIEKAKAAAHAYFSGSDGEHAVVGKDTAFTLHVALRNLTVEQRRAIEMAYFEGKTQEQIAEELREPLGTVKSRIRRGLMVLREYLDGVL